MKLRKTLMYFDSITKNGRIYPYGCYDFSSLKSYANNGSLLGELEHPNSMDISLINVSHSINDIEVYQDCVEADITILSRTPKGKILQELIDGGVEINFRPRLSGTVDEYGYVTVGIIYTFDAIPGDDGWYHKTHFRKKKIMNILKNIEYDK